MPPVDDARTHPAGRPSNGLLQTYMARRSNLGAGWRAFHRGGLAAEPLVGAARCALSTQASPREDGCIKNAGDGSRCGCRIGCGGGSAVRQGRRRLKGASSTGGTRWSRAHSSPKPCANAARLRVAASRMLNTWSSIQARHCRPRCSYTPPPRPRLLDSYLLLPRFTRMYHAES